MNLYKISQSVNNNYDTYSDAVVCALTAWDARHIHPGGDQSDSMVWAEPKQVKVELIGKAAKGVMPGVICASFHAG